MSTNSQVAHQWAQQNKDSGKTSTGNFSFQGRSVYSYTTEIARFINGKVIYTNRTYTPTTSSKHQPNVRRAISHLESYSTPRRMNEISNDWLEVSQMLFNDMLQGLLSTIQELVKARANFNWKLDRLIGSAHDVRKFHTAYIFEHPEITIKVNSDHLPLEHLSILTGTPTLPQTKEAIHQLLKDHYKIDVAKKLEATEKAEKKNAEKRLEQQAAYERIRAERAKEEALDLERWKTDLSYTRTFYSSSIHLRINRDLLETSHGARVPLSEAIAVYNSVKAGQRVEGVRVGDFTVRSVSADTLIVGCHNIPLSEVERMAKLVGLVSEDQNYVN